MTALTTPPARGVRVPYDALPPHLRSWIDDQLGSPVVSAVTQPDGFSPGVAARLQLANGTRAFVKALSAETNADGPALHRRESEVLRLLPSDLPVPRLIAAYDEHPWVALLIEDADGRHPALPWDDREIGRVLTLMRTVNAVTGLHVGSIGEQFAEWSGFEQLAAGTGPRDAWTAQHLTRLVALEQTAPAATAGDHLLHVDLRADNVLLGAERDWLVDWPWARTGAPWVDVVLAAPCIALQGGPGPDELLRRAGVHADDTAVTALVAAFAGLMVHRGGLPAPPGLPTIRRFQAAQGRVALEWLRERTRW